MSLIQKWQQDPVILTSSGSPWPQNKDKQFVLSILAMFLEPLGLEQRDEGERGLVTSAYEHFPR